MQLFPDLKPTALPPEIRFVQGDVNEVDFACIADASLVVADPPWTYEGGLYGRADVAEIEKHYANMSMGDIVRALNRVHAAFPEERTKERGVRLAMWATFPLLERWFHESHDLKWRYVSGGAWVKDGGGVGHHWLGAAELVLLYTKGVHLTNHFGALRNGHASQRRQHSEKPTDWMAQWIERWTEPGDLVVDIFSGLGPLARACHRTKRRYIGFDSDASRIEKAEDLLRAFMGGVE
jgi:hypothetical protein